MKNSSKPLIKMKDSNNLTYKPTIPKCSSENLILPQAPFLKEEWPIQDLTAADSGNCPCRPKYLCRHNINP